MDKVLLNTVNICRISARNFGNHNKKFVYKNGVKYDNVFYYPRHSDHQDPSFVPSKLFMVRRIGPYKGIPYWEKRIIRDLGLSQSQNEIAVVKNTPDMNSLLWKVKHLIKITPITFPHGEPTEEDINYTYLKRNGECIVAKEIKVEENRLQATDEFVKDQKRLDNETLKRDSRMKWLNPW
ncbi:large ribosomal subunit protein uL30m [Phlebotomus argentipes]|uniref:large ribosomal subunit protein uL30m n=1 Tax=Phlebotomus argentipes TaxID=94469 RepID=UPI002893142E|nr:large ribosomal subunit protein uL30m [Phlebotomus argentipes]